MNAYFDSECMPIVHIARESWPWDARTHPPKSLPSYPCCALCLVLPESSSELWFECEPFQTGPSVWSEVWPTVRTEPIIRFSVQLMPQICEPVQTCPNVFEPFLLLSMIHLISRMTKTLDVFLLVVSDFLGDLLDFSVSPILLLSHHNLSCT
jgi:hypothetical protein